MDKTKNLLNFLVRFDSPEPKKFQEVPNFLHDFIYLIRPVGPHDIGFWNTTFCTN
jgi:hypothetical protein